MQHVRMKVSIHLNREHALSVQMLDSMKPAIERAIAAALPDTISVDTVKVTKLKEATPRELESP